MAGNTLTTGATLQCPHGGQVQFAPGNLRVKLNGVPLATTADTALVVGCPFAPAAAPMPCVSMRWTVTDLQTKAGGSSMLSQGSVGLCLNAAQAPQGPVVVVSTQSGTRSR